MNILLLILIASTIGGSVPVVVKIGLASIPPLSFVFIRALLITIMLLPLFWKNKEKFLPKNSTLIPISLLSVANVLLFTYGVQFITAINTQILYTTLPIIASLLAFILLHERFNRTKILGILIGVIGSLVVMIVPLIKGELNIATHFLGNLLIFVGIILFSTYTVLSKNLLKKYSPLFMIYYFFFLIVVVLFVPSIIESLSTPWWKELTPSAVWVCLYTAGATFTFYILYQYIIKHTTPVIAATAFYLQPISTYVWGSLLLKEEITTELVVGGLLIVAGVWLTTKSTQQS